MGWFRDLNEKYFTKGASQTRVLIDDTYPEEVVEASDSEIFDFVTKIKTVGKSREELIEQMEIMSFDSIISSAIELLADDATQLDPVRKKSVWIDSEDIELAEELNSYLEEINIEENLWTYTYQVIKYGEMFLKTYDAEFRDETVDETIEGMKGYIFERVDDPTEISELLQYGFTVGYADIPKVAEGKKKKDVKLSTPDDYIHFINDRKGKREKIALKVDDESIEYKIRYGSPAFESALQAWAMLDLLETLLLYTRFGRSSYFRIVKVEVGAAAKGEVLKIIRNVKAKFTTQPNLDTKKDQFVGIKKPLPHGEMVYLPVKQGKGDVNIDEIGGNVDIKDIADIEYWRNKLFAALKMPKAYLGFEETQPGGLGNISLTRQDIRYARSVKVIKKVIAAGIKDMVDYYLKTLDREDEKDNYKVVMTEVMSAETSDMKEDLMFDITLAEALINLLQDKEDVNNANLTKVIINDILDLGDKYPELVGKDGSDK